MIPRVFDTDQHITPPKDMWTSRMAKKYQDLAPKVVDIPEGGQAWSFEGGAHLHLFGLENVGAKDPAELSWQIHYDDIAPAYYQPKARLESMDVDGIDAALFFPSVAGHCGIIHDDDLYLECIRAYNDGAWDWTQEGDPKRMYPTALIPAMGVETAMEEVSRVAKKGFRHIQFFASPTGGPFPMPSDDPFWGLIQDTGMVVSIHGGGRGRMKLPPEAIEAAKNRPATAKPPNSQVPIAAGRAAGLGAPQSLALMITTGVFERFPNLKAGLIETSAGWLPSMLNRLDAEYTQHRWLSGQSLSLLPSEYFKRQVKISVDREIAGIKHRDQIGSDSLMFGTDFPHIGSFYPHTRRYIDLLFDDVPEDETHAILWGNAAELYGVN